MQLLAEVFHRMFDTFDGIFYVPFGILPYFPDGALRLALRAGKGRTVSGICLRLSFFLSATVPSPLM